MNNLLHILFILFAMGVMNAQENFEWDEIIETPDETKNQLYSKAKLFVAEAYVSAQDVIQNDDKESGIILLKGASITEVKVNMMHIHRAIFNYTVKIYIKDNKSRIVVENVHGKSSTVSSNTWPTLPVGGYPEVKGYRKTSLKEKKYLEIMDMLRSDIQSMVNNFKVVMNQPLEVEEDW